MARKDKGFSLIEIVIVMAILLLLILVILGFMGLTQLKKSRDARRKGDLNKISNAFEDYFNDNGCYPENLSIFEDCGGSGFRPWLNSIPCDPLGFAYKIIIDDQDCPHWYKIYANMEYAEDPFIMESGCGGGCFVDGQIFNYGVSSPNVTIGTAPPPSPTNTPVPPTPIPNCIPITGCCWQEVDGACNGPRSMEEPPCEENCYNDKYCRSDCYLPDGCSPTRPIDECLRAAQGI